MPPQPAFPSDNSLSELTLDQQFPVVYSPTLSNTEADKSFCQPSDTLHGAPRLLKLLTGRDQAALAACDKQLCSLMRCGTKAVCVHSCKSVCNILSKDWPQLALIVLRDQHMKPPIQETPTHKTNVLATLQLSHSQGSHHCTAFIVVAKSGHSQPVADAASVQSSTTAAASSRCRQLTALDLSSHVAAAISYLRKAGSQKVDNMV